ncbi:MAG: FrgA protein [Myxococcaceae bacterium]
MPARLAQHLIQRGLLPAERVNEALRRQAVAGGALDTLLLEQGSIAEAGMLQALADVSHARPVNLADFEPNHEVASLIPQRVAERLGIVPLSVDAGTLHVASVYPPSPKDIGEVGLLLGRQVEIWVAVEARVRDWIASIYKQPLPTRYAALLAALDPSRPLPASALLPNAPKAIAPTPPPPKQKGGLVVVEDSSLEESLTRDMVEQLARNVAEEPILLQTKKAPPEPPRAAAPPPPSDREQTRAAPPVPSDREETRVVPSLQGRPPTDYEPTVVRSAYTPEAAKPATWDREETRTLSAETYAQFVRESKTAQEQAAKPPEPLPSLPSVAPVAAPATPPKRAKTEPSFEIPAALRAAQPEERTVELSAPTRSAPPPPQEQPPQQYEAPQQYESPQQPQWGAPSAPEVTIDYNVPTTTPGARRPPAGVVIFPGSRNGGPAQVAGDLPMPAVDRRAPPPEPPPEQQQQAQYDEIPKWSLADAREVLRQGTSDREYIIDVALRFARQTFEFTCAFAVVRGAAVGWDARGENVDRAVVQQISIPLDAQSVFRTVALTRGSFVGPLPPDQLTHYFLSLLGRNPRTAFVFPVEVKGRLVAILYGDCGPKPISQRRLSDFILFCQELPGAFQELIVYRKRYLQQQWAEQQQVEVPLPDTNAAYGTYEQPAGYDQQYAGYEQQQQQPQPGEPGYEAQVQFDAVPPPVSPYEREVQREEPPGLTAAAPLLSSATDEAPRPAGLGWGAGGWGSGKASGVGRSASMPVFVTEVAERPPPDFTPVLRRLIGPDAADRSRAMAELARVPEAAARVLAENFPGPTAWSRLPVMELPEADELGPIPAAMARLGRSGAQALAPLLDSDDSDTRYLALLTAGNLPFPELVGGVLRGLFDYEPDISSAARAAAFALRRVPRFDAAMKDLRRELAATDPLRRSLAARALGGLHDRESVDGLINLTNSDDQMAAQAAAEALREITRASYGTTTRFWLAWWAENRDKRRVEWLVAALRSREFEMRQAAIDELSRAVSDTLGYLADVPENEREPAVRRWEALLTQTERGRKFEL